jgi:SAM-dependent methyltransferase
MATLDFNTHLHALRTEGLRRMPAGARTFLSAGCSGGWYFRWIAENYPGIERHIGVEAYSPKPDDLPEGACWIANSVADMREVADGSVDLLFSGQNIEHLTLPDIGGFLCEAKRVLRPGGWLVIDSPNRAITERLGWFQPEHVMEFRVDEILDLVRAAGFETESIRGLWQCYDPGAHRVLDLSPSADDADNRRRVEAANDDPENAFVWWLTARSVPAPADRAAIDARVEKVAAEAFPRLLTRFQSEIGRVKHGPLTAEAEGPKGAVGYILYGPYTPLFPGRYRAAFRLRALAPAGLIASVTGARLARIDVGSFYRNREIVARDLDVKDLTSPSADGYCSFALNFELADAAFGVEFRVYTTGLVPLAVAVPVHLTRLT